MIQTIVVIVLILADVALVQFNLPALQARITLGAPGMEATAVTVLGLAAAAGGAVVLVWIAGQIDRAGLEHQIRRRDLSLRAMGEEVLRMKAAAYDKQHLPLSNIQAHLDALDRDVRDLRKRVDEAGARDDSRARPAVPVAGRG